MMGGRNPDTDPEGRAWFAAFRKALEELGWVEGRNFRADYRWPSGEVAGSCTSSLTTALPVSRTWRNRPKARDLQRHL